jgi:hypothetical protein
LADVSGDLGSPSWGWSLTTDERVWQAWRSWDERSGRARCTFRVDVEVTEVSATMRRVRVPETFPRERVVLGELHLLRSRLDGVRDQIGVVLRQPEMDEEAWPRVEEATRLARRALVAAVGAVPSRPAASPAPGLLQDCWSRSKRWRLWIQRLVGQ